jgi:lipoate-protein ligase A
MALDRALLLSRAEGECPPTLRLYRWSRPTVSIGRFQRVEDVDTQWCREQGIDVVRRPTGGRGVLHYDEVTYSVVASVADGVPRGTAASYRHLCSALAAAYAEIGVPAELTGGRRGEPSAAACYLHATSADLSLGAAKLSGSAQLWHGDTCLQHGSFVVSRDLALESAVFGLDDEAQSALQAATETIAGALGRRIGYSGIRSAVVAGFETALGIQLKAGRLSPGERESAIKAVRSTASRSGRSRAV